MYGTDEGAIHNGAFNRDDLIISSIAAMPITQTKNTPVTILQFTFNPKLGRHHQNFRLKHGNFPYFWGIFNDHNINYLKADGFWFLTV